MNRPGVHMARCWAALCAAVCMTLVSCDSIDEDRVPAMPVQIALNNPGLWATYGVAGYGQTRNFIREDRVPANFPYTETTYTGYGGVLLIMGMDPYSAGDVVPLAYDLSCPVECLPTVRVAVDPASLEAVCPSCHSHYDVTLAGGAPVSGPALTGVTKYALQRYRAYPQGGGYMIAR